MRYILQYDVLKEKRDSFCNTFLHVHNDMPELKKQLVKTWMKSGTDS